jgi:hypothetical protein
MLVEVERNLGFKIQIGDDSFAVFAGTQVRDEVGAPAHSL